MRLKAGMCQNVISMMNRVSLKRTPPSPYEKRVVGNVYKGDHTTLDQYPLPDASTTDRWRCDQYLGYLNGASSTLFAIYYY